MLRRKKEAEPEVTEERIGTWADTGYRASDDEAHRNVRYDGASPIGRIAGVFMAQMKLFSKNKWTFIMIFAAVLIPVITLIMPAEIMDSLRVTAGGSTQYIGLLLCFMPLMVAFFTAVLCGTQIPNEFKDRTAYMSIPLPVSRTEFYIGKYLAGFVCCLGVFLLAFGFATIMAMADYDQFFSDMILYSLGVTVVTIFAYSATAFCLGTFMRRGSALVPMMLMFIILPAVMFYVYARFETDVALMLPCFLPDAALSALGAPISVSLTGIFGITPDMDSVGTMLAIGVVWGAAFLAIGAYRMNKREM